MVKFENIPNEMQVVIDGKHYKVTKDSDYPEEEATLIAQHLGLVLKGKSSKQANVGTTTSNIFGKKKINK